MDEEIIEEVAPIDAAEGAHLQGKEVEYLVKPDNCNVLVSQEMVIPVEVNASFRVLGDVLEGKNALEHGCTSPCTYNDENDMVEELTLRNYNGSNIPVVGTSNYREKNADEAEPLATSLSVGKRIRKWGFMRQDGQQSGNAKYATGCKVCIFS